MPAPDANQQHTALPQDDHDRGGGGQVGRGEGAGAGSSRKARAAGGAQGYEAQQRALTPGGPGAQGTAPGHEGPLSPAKAARALRYNRRRQTRQGAAWVGKLQGLVGTPPTGAYDDATDQAVATWQGAKGLRVDGEVGPKTERKVAQALPPAARTPKSSAAAAQAKPGTRTGPAGPPDEAAADQSGTVKASPAPAASAPAATVDAATVDAITGAAPVVAKNVDEAKSGQTPGAQEGEGPGLARAIAAMSALGAPVFPAKPGEVDLAPVLAWTTKAAAAFAHASTVFASPTLSAVDRAALASVMATQASFVGPLLKSLFVGVRATAIKLVNESSALKAGTKPPSLPDQATTQAIGGALRKLERVANGGALGPGGALMLDASHLGQDALLAIAQGRAVLAARETWKKGIREPSGDKVAAHRKKKDDPLNKIFADAGWSRYGVTAITTKKGHKKVADWCGMFVAAHMFRGGGLDQELRAGFLHTTNVLDFFQYQQKANAARAPKSVWADGAWHDLHTYHGARGSLRKWTPRATITSAMEAKTPLDIRPGDVVLIDHKGNKKSPQHITMVESYDPATQTLVTIEGNTRGIQAPDGKGTAADGTQWYKNHHGRDGSGIHRRDLTTMSAKSQTAWAAVHKDKEDAYRATKAKAGAEAASQKRTRKDKADARKRAEGDVYEDKKGATVFGIGRPSIVDFEEHEYASHAVPSDYQQMSPTEIRTLAKQHGKRSKAARVGVLKPR